MIPYGDVGEPSVAVRDLVSAVNGLAAAATGLRDPEGGLRKSTVLATLTPGLERLGFDTRAVALPAASRFGDRTVPVDALHEPTATALSVHAGRAWTNHEATVAVLAMAAATTVRHAVVVVPDRYKGGAAGSNVVDFLRTLSTFRGVHLDLDHVAVVMY